MATDEDFVFIWFFQIVIFCVIGILKRNKRKKKLKNFKELGMYKIFLTADDKLFATLVRLNRDEFDYVLEAIKHKISSSHHRAIPPDLKLLITLNFLANGSSKIKTAVDFGVGEATISRVLDEVTQAIIDILAPEYLAYPNKEEWMKVEEGFQRRWNVPNTLGAVDGKQFRLQKPSNNGSVFFSVCIMAVVDYDYHFKIVDVGDLVSDHDGGYFKNTSFGEAIYGDGTGMDWPEYKALPGSNDVLPHFIIGDDAFQLSARLMKPYPGRGLSTKKKIYNYRMSRARQVVENAFGILAAQWRIFQNSMVCSPERSKRYIYAAIVLHNMLCTRRRAEYIPPGYPDEESPDGEIIEGSYRKDILGNNLQPLPPSFIRNSKRNAGRMRNKLADYFLTETGRLSWQEDYVNRVSR